MVHVIELAVVVFSRRWSQIKERPAKKLALRATSSTASVGTISLEKKCTHIKKITLGEQITYNELLVDVKLRFDVCRYFLWWYAAKSGKLVGSLFSTGIVVSQAQVFEIIDSLGLHQRYRLQIVLDGSSIIVWQPALQSDVIVFSTTAYKVPLQEQQHTLNITGLLLV